MLSLFKALLKILFGKSNEVQEIPLEKTGFSIDHEWPFPSPEPPNAEYLVGELIKGVEVEGDHVFFFWEGQKRRHIRTPKGTETVLARHVIWWMEGRKHPEVANGLTTNCGEQKCIKLSHLTLRTSQTVLGPPKPKPAPSLNHVPKSKQPPQPKGIRGRKLEQRDKFEKGDRTKCMTAKVYFMSDKEARSKARILNAPDVRGRGRKVYPYACPMCDGFHLTKIDPKKYTPRKIGNW